MAIDWGEYYGMSATGANLNYRITTNTTGVGMWNNGRIINPSEIRYGDPFDGKLTYGEEEVKNKIPEGVEMKMLYDVYMIYAEEREKPQIFREDGVIANNEEDAKIKSGLMKEVSELWDSDYLTFICKEIGEVKIKEKPKEVKNV